MRHISFNRYDAILYLDEFEDHCLTLKNAPHVILKYVVYETLVKEEDQARSTPDPPHYTFDMRRISIKTSPELSKTSEGHAPHTRTSYAASKGGVRIFQNIIILDPTRS